ncbi:rhodanese-like domain-containing protein [Acaricomes phytoseiuli]|uniref:rhodanese-like domain-containing protein n=1 Tax=Acaricomes phytoseiuli TaxID=291968 RepID=UPI0003AA393F|nr:rhodanese-like domain-containing protein [Acaricomes phytoseiuli]MCW1249699.1 rhodanese-like domain-containing protein [Acaricomes phytoseiuli]
MSDFETVSLDQLPEGALILDVRKDQEWAEGHIEGALHIPLDHLPARFAELDPDQDTYILCRTGGRSFRASQWLAAQGYSVFNIAGGMGAWQDAERPMVSETGAPPQVR